MTTWAVIQARMGSTRFPGKVLAPCGGMPILARVVTLTRMAATPDWRLVIATTRRDEDAVIAEWARALGVDCFRGEETDVLQRFLDLATSQQMADDDVIVRLTADDPMRVPALIRAAAERVTERGVVYDTNHGQLQGLGAEALYVGTLREHAASCPAAQREHVTAHLLRARLPVTVSVDTPDDLRRLEGFA